MIFTRRKALFVFLLFLPAFIFARDILVIVEDEDIAMPLEGAVVITRGGSRFICD